MINKIEDFQNVFFIGIAGVGMSAIAQYLKGTGKEVSGSDRYFHPNEFNRTKEQLEAEGINCYLQDGSGISEKTDLVVVSTAIEDTVFEVQKARELGITIVRRSELLSVIAKQDLFAEVTDRIAFLRILDKNREHFMTEEVADKLETDEL